MKATMQDYPLTTARLMRYGSSAHGDSTLATWTSDGARSRTYREVGLRAAQLAHGLRELGVTGDARVGTFMFNNSEHVETYLAVPSMGAVLHTLNIRLFPDQLIYVVNHAADSVVVADAALVPVLTKLLPQMTTVRHVVVAGGAGSSGAAAPAMDAVRDAVAGSDVAVHDYDELIAGRPETYDWPEIDETEGAAICYTSGTTGNPKGVVYSHRSIWLHSTQVNMVESFGLSDADTVLAVVPQFHAMAWGLPFAAFMSGASLLMPDRFLQPEPLVRMISELRPTFSAAVPSIWTEVLRYLDENGGDISSLREVVVGGSACPPSLMTGMLERHGVRIIHAWGMTEMSPLGSVCRPPASTLGTDAEFGYRVSQGRLPAGVEHRLVGPDGSVVPDDGESVGEVEVRGPWITGSYLHDPAEDKFDDGWLRTGDVGSVSPDGFLRLTDRSKDVIKSGGEWISSVELENALMAHPDLIEACVVGVPDDRWGERPLAAVVVRDGAHPEFADLRAFLGGQVARWQLPERWAVIDEVPKTSVGKFDKKLVRQRYADGQLDVTTLR
jgi:fatty-acyl-CoA synthase